MAGNSLGSPIGRVRIQDFGNGGVRLIVKYYNALHSRTCARRFSLFLKFWGPPIGGGDPAKKL